MTKLGTRRGLARAALAAGAAAAFAVTLGSCAYYNTFYLARKNYETACAGQPYVVDRNAAVPVQNFNKAIDYSKKVIGEYPKSKWVDDAYILWAASLLGKDDPRETVNMLQDFPTRFPKSSRKSDAEFYLGLGYRQSHRPTEALGAFDGFLKDAPKHKLAPYALLERARVLRSLSRPADAAEAAGVLLERFPKSTLAKQARIERAEARLEQGDPKRAREDFHALGLAADDDDERFNFLLREADCLEAGHDYDGEIALLRGALSHERTPIPVEIGSGASITRTAPTGPGVDRWGRLRLRIGTAHLLAGQLDPALGEFKQVIQTYPKNPLAAEGQYRVGYGYETVGDDFEKARQEYAKVKDQAGLGAFTTQANARMTNLDRISQLRGATGGRDSTQRKAEAGFLLAEQYLFQLDKPDRALEEYGKLAHDFSGTPYGGKAMNAMAWVLSRKFQRKAAADSLFWRVVHEYPATEAQLAARDYLEGDSIAVADSLIKAPIVVPDTTSRADTLALTQPPASVPRLGTPAGADSLKLGGHALPPGFGSDAHRRMQDQMARRPGGPADSLAQVALARQAALADSLRRAQAHADSLIRLTAPKDTTKSPPVGSPR
ncbi:MAG TPA: tetratricopeptide repeat protein [Candidatus Saccharimonadaceae bacterium]|nr:tetratricopeptide repeat protein [Candidatus Saccharimonadaceae bacterium]